MDDFKNSFLAKGKRYTFKDVAFSNKGTISLLNQAFGTHIFNKYCFLEKSSSKIIADDRKRTSRGMAEVGFGSKEDMQKAIEIIKSMHQSYFRLEAATFFVLLKEQNTIIIVFAELPEPGNEITACFFNRIKMRKGEYVAMQ